MKQALFFLFLTIFFHAKAQTAYFDRFVEVPSHLVPSVQNEWDDTLTYTENLVFRNDRNLYSFEIVSVEWVVLPDSMQTFLQHFILTDSIGLEHFVAGPDQVVSVQLPRFKISDQGKAERLKSFVLRATAQPVDKAARANSYTTASVLSSGKWAKLSVSDRGMCKIPYSRLVEMGFSEPQKIAVYSNGGYMLPKMNSIETPDDLTKLPVLHAKDATGADCIFFFSTGNVKWNYNKTTDFFEHELNLYSDKTYFYLTADQSPSEAPKLMEDSNETPSLIINSYDFLALEEKESVSLIQSGRTWWGDKFLHGASRTYTFGVTNPIGGSASKMKISAAARSKINSTMSVSINDIAKGGLAFNSTDLSSSYADWVKPDMRIFEFTSASNVKVVLNFQAQSTESAWLDYISINTKAQLEFESNQLLFRDKRALSSASIGYQVSGVDANSVVWNVSDPLNPRKIQLQSNGSYTFAAAQGKINEYVVFDPAKGNFLFPVLVEPPVANQNIHGEEVPQMVIVTHPNFLDQSNELAEFHRNHDKLSVLVVTTPQVFNEFSSGLPDVAAIRNMMRMFYVRSKATGAPLKYLLLMGDGSYDNRNFDDTKKNNFIPTYQSVNSISPVSSFVSDDFFGLLDDGEGEVQGALDIGIGRIPCKTPSEASIVVEKIKNYVEPDAMGAWRNQITFIADDEDQNIHMRDTESLISVVDQKYPGFYTNKIYFDAYQQKSTAEGDKYPDVTTAINNSVKEGTLILNYVGHANSESMAHEKVIGISEINTWNNTNKLPIFVTATCEFSMFDADATSAGEYVLFNPVGGAVGLFSTTRVVYSYSNYLLSNNFYQNAFNHDENGENLRMGDIMRLAKVATTNDTNKLNFSLLADPALRLAFPKYEVRTLTIQGKDPQTEAIEIGALEKVTITGEVVDHTGTRRTEFNGVLTPSIYDKPVTVQTLSNDGEDVFKFETRDNLIYKGNTSVKNGYFELSFIVPKDISYNMGNGKIFYYVQNESEDGNGSTASFGIGGTASNATSDNTPPVIDVYLNNEQFRSGDVVKSSALLLVKLFDDSGINTVGTGIGHDLIAILDSNYSNPLVLNSYYSSEIDDFQRGTVLFPLNNLEVGEHTLRVKAWDVHNNSSEQEIRFVVKEGFEITSVKSFPTVVTDGATFEIAHNLPGETFNAVIEFFNTAGQRLDRISSVLVADYSGTLSVAWEPNAQTVRASANPMVVYQVILTNADQEQALGTGKILFKPKKN